jgi:hypothetical protein
MLFSKKSSKKCHRTAERFILRHDRRMRTDALSPCRRDPSPTLPTYTHRTLRHMITNSHNASGTIPRPHHPHRRSSLPNKRSHGSSNQSSQSIFVGLSLALDKEREGRVAWELAVSDGFGMIGTEHGEGHGYDFSEGGDGVKTCVETLVHRLRDFEVTQGYNVGPILSPLSPPILR